jgi:hypothetical protein
MVKRRIGKLDGRGSRGCSHSGGGANGPRALCRVALLGDVDVDNIDGRPAYRPITSDCSAECTSTYREICETVPKSVVGMGHRLTSAGVGAVLLGSVDQRGCADGSGGVGVWWSRGSCERA